jgi:hypothetical protein
MLDQSAEGQGNVLAQKNRKILLINFFGEPGFVNKLNKNQNQRFLKK